MSAEENPDRMIRHIAARHGMPVPGEPGVAFRRDLDRLKTRVQETGRSYEFRITLAEALEIASDLGLDPAEIEFRSGSGHGWIVMQRV